MNIDEIKRQGEIDAIKNAIRDRQFEIANNFDFHTTKDVYVDLVKVVARARVNLTEIEALFAALNELQPGHK